MTNRLSRTARLGAGGITVLGLLAAASALAAPPITVSEPWFRYIVPQVPAGGYMTLRNAAASPVVLTGGSSPACGMLMLHRSESGGGADRMVHVPSVAVPPGGTLAFAPGGYHLMCMEPRMKPGDRVDVTLTFKGGQTISAAFPVFGPAGKPGAK